MFIVWEVLGAKNAGFREEDIGSIVANSISQSLQQNISKAKNRVTETCVSTEQAIDELKDELIRSIVEEYSNQDGWRFPIFDDQQNIFSPDPSSINVEAQPTYDLCISEARDNIC